MWYLKEKKLNYIILLFIFLIVALFVYLIIKNSEALGLMQKHVDNLTNQVNQQLQGITMQLQSTTGQIGNRLDKTTQIVKDVGESLGRVSEATKQLYEVGKDISSLQDLLRAPKFRGEFGEFLLESLLSQILTPEFYRLNYGFKDGTKVEAVICLGDKVVPVDAKFPLDSFKRIIESESEEEKQVWRKDFIRKVKEKIDQISKYIKPDEGTYDFALMYIPAENVYYETIIRDESFGGENSILGFALEKRVIPVSPNSFLAYLYAIASGLKGLKIEERAHDILIRLNSLVLELNKFKEDFETLGMHLNRAKNKYEEADKQLSRFDNKLSSLNELSTQEDDRKSLPS